jgi:thiol-disulfide isomerase/thioredoxin
MKQKARPMRPSFMLRRFVSSFTMGLLAILGSGLFLVAATTPQQEQKDPSHSPKGPVVRPLNADGLAKTIVGNRGKILVLNLWATWCPPCQKEFPALARLARDWEKKGVKVVTVSMDDRKDLPDVEAFLADFKAPLNPAIQAIEDPRLFFQLVDPDWQGTVPTTVIWDETGKRVFTFMGEMTYDEMERPIRILVARMEANQAARELAKPSPPEPTSKKTPSAPTRD